MDQAQIEIQVLGALSQISAAEWDACACPEAVDGGRPLDPFTTHRFLLALEESGSVGRGTGWQPQYLTAYLDGMLIAAAPMYAKSHSQGEYIFDHSWAHAYESAGGRYYPKLQIAVPFTPATGRRFLVRPGYERIGMSALVQGAVQLAADNQVSSVHATFCTEDEALAGEQMGLMLRSSQQFHWLNEGYSDFDAFLAVLSSRKRKNIRKERAQANDFGGDIRTLTGEALRPEHWDAFWRFYQDTGARKWGSPYLTRQFFDIAQETMADDMALVLAERNGYAIAGALNFIGRETLFGRYWGCVEHHACLHFELCYYRAIDFAIARGLARVEAGAQGEHKLARGYLPTRTHSLHWVGDPGFADAVKKYLDAEGRAVGEEIEILTDYGPFRKSNPEEQQ
ncbi:MULTISPECIES: GNAT family N-acetyltransferase [unclassified Ruegeria]|uniref:GNAT family N-acetyltransferase n=1 Tax=unclassified Ruegeria TaxID=2625375 RepID=UPI001492F6AC|nr:MULTISPECIES: GNAT family N-acetyltransferase [unclassified Ruegeria]NOD48797.1 GNAT family N-acetyltransferase [Ruegeria sp. HKCCD5849]NOD51900.1 GNAT family N-acetyltransferase [Ruegeria sp. HKCCD5851]NOD66558.1 GNAT family N-acetyltransferase [Ruegeria sp. HKCCD7303]